MRLPLPAPLSSLPTPGDVVRLLRRTASAADALLDAVPRVVALLGEAEAFLARAQGLLDRVESTRAAADDIVARAAAAVDRVEGVVDSAGGVVDRSEGVVDRADGVALRAGTTVDETQGTIAAAAALSERVRELLDLTEPSLVRLQPTLTRLAETTHPEEVDALVALVDLLPGLAQRMEDEVVPILTSLGTVGPDIHDLLAVSAELNELLASVPGLSRIKKRIDEEQDDDD